MSNMIRQVVACIGTVLVVMAISAAHAGSNSASQSLESSAATDPVGCTWSTTGQDSGEEAMCGKCGDGFCNPRCGETATSCPADCGVTT